MARVNIYLPDDLAERARVAGLNVSSLARSAVEAELARRLGMRWLAQVARLRPPGVPASAALEAVHAAQEELAADG
ncbi:MAG TPA: type II toxin-antitoxin system CcdA family antitoxin [Dermatophilaceae bacterium]|nr:type II toxin-antitoxin system CcdA family antitoxin [Dermatophilaceae bacterium]